MPEVKKCFGRGRRLGGPRSSGTLDPTNIKLHPHRKSLPHHVPHWVLPNSRYFITINCQARGVNTIAIDKRAVFIINSALHYEQLDKWYIHVLVLMPDHLHVIATFNRDVSIAQTISAWKSFLRRKAGIRWQRYYFEHRLRNDAAFSEKIYYVLMNPIRGD